MAVDIPVPKIVPDVGPGGQIFDVLQRLKQAQQENKKRELENQYYGQTAQANALSKLAYANLMGPQFMAKLMGNQDILANLPDDQKRQALQQIYQAGSGQGTGNALQNFIAPPKSDNEFGGIAAPILNMIFDKIKRKDIAQSQPQNALLASPKQSLQQSSQEFGAVNRATPEEVNQIATYGNQIPSSTTPSFAQNVGTYKGIVEEGKESGSLRAKDIKELNDTVFDADTKLATLGDINEMISSPEMRKIRELPLAGRHEMAWYAKEGTPAQQQLVGRLYAQMGNIVKDSSRDFAGQFRKGEQQLLHGMKPNDSDTVDTMIGKSESLTVMTRLLRERAALTSKIMNQYHINKGEASEIADKQINGEQIRRQIHNQLNPKPTDEDIRFMAKKYSISPDEVRKRLKAKGLL